MDGTKITLMAVAALAVVDRLRRRGKGSPARSQSNDGSVVIIDSELLGPVMMDREEEALYRQTGHQALRAAAATPGSPISVNEGGPLDLTVDEAAVLEHDGLIRLEEEHGVVFAVPTPPRRTLRGPRYHARRGSSAATLPERVRLQAHLQRTAR